MSEQRAGNSKGTRLFIAVMIWGVTLLLLPLRSGAASYDDAVRAISSSDHAAAAQAWNTLVSGGTDAIGALIGALPSQNQNGMVPMVMMMTTIKRKNKAAQMADRDARAFGQIMRNVKTAEARDFMLQALQDVGGTAPLRELERAAHDDPSAGNRRDATLFVGSIAPSEIGFFRKQISDPSRWVRLTAYEYLAEAGDSSGRALALATLNGPSSGVERQEAIWVLGEIGNSSDSGVLEKFADSGNESLTTRFLAREALKSVDLNRIPAGQRATYLINALDDPSMTVRHWAANRLLRSNDPGARPKLTRYISEPGHKGYSEAASALHQR